MASPFQQAVDADLIERARQGEPAAHAALFDRFGRAVYNLARRLLVKPDLAEDVLQDTFVEVLRQLDGFRGEAPFGMWVRRIAVNHCLMYLRSPWQRRRLELDGDDDGVMPSAADGNFDVLDLERALAALPPEARAVVWLHDVEGYTHQEIGRMLNATSSFSKSQLVRAYARMRGWASSNAAGEQSCTPLLSN
ncbi:MAG TPA: RNA polymerase sigma factor [Gammaproteobacteria bacterium]|nr:RNA polymerase sigma factor [Gammaproteobacteria bacterium]